MQKSEGCSRGGLGLEEAGGVDFGCLSQNVAHWLVGLMHCATEFGPPGCFPHVLPPRKIDRASQSSRARTQTRALEIRHLSYVTASDSKPPVE